MTAGLFDAIRLPKWTVWAEVGTTTTSNLCVRGSGLRGTNVRGGTTLVDISTTNSRYCVRSIHRSSFGRDAPLEPASPAQCVIVFNNGSNAGDGDYDPTYAGGAWFGALDIGVKIQVRAEWPVGVFHPRFTGEIVDISIDAGEYSTVTITCADGLEKLGRTQLPVEGAQFAGDLTGQRISNLADRADWPVTDRAIDDGHDLLGPTLLGATAAELMRQVEATEAGFLFVNEAGQLVFFDRYRTLTASRSAVAQVAITDTATAGTINMMDLTMSRSRERVSNDIHLTRDPDPTQDPELTGTEPGDVPVEMVAQDATSIEAHGALNLPVDAGKLHRSDAAVLGMAQGLLAWFKDPQDRIREVHLNGLAPKVAAENLYAKFLSLTLLDRISVSRDYGANTIAAELLIQQLEETVESDPPAWELRLTTANPPPAPPSPVCVRGAGLRGTHKRIW